MSFLSQLKGREMWALCLLFNWWLFNYLLWYDISILHNNHFTAEWRRLFHFLFFVIMQSSSQNNEILMSGALDSIENNSDVDSQDAPSVWTGWGCTISSGRTADHCEPRSFRQRSHLAVHWRVLLWSHVQKIHWGFCLWALRQDEHSQLRVAVSLF